MLINQSIRPQKMCYIHQYIANVCNNSLIHSVFEKTFDKPMKFAIEKHVFLGGGEISPPLGG